MNTTTDFKQFGKWQSQSKEAPFRLTNFGFNRGSHDRYQFLKNDYDFDPPTSKINQRHMLMNTSPLATFQAGQNHHMESHSYFEGSISSHNGQSNKHDIHYVPSNKYNPERTHSNMTPSRGEKMIKTKELLQQILDYKQKESNQSKRPGFSQIGGYGRNGRVQPTLVSKMSKTSQAFNDRGSNRSLYQVPKLTAP